MSDYAAEASGAVAAARAAVDRAWSLATRTAEMKSKTSDDLFDKALGAAGKASSMTAAKFTFSPNVIEPPVAIPELAEGATMEVFNAWWTNINDALTQNFAWFIDKYFPNECDYLGKVQQWICKTLTEGGTGMAPHVEDQIWQRDRARLLKDAQRTKREVLTTFAARGFPLPPGAAAGAVSLVMSETQDKIAQASRDVAIKQAEIEIENVRFAVDKAIGLYSAAIGAAGDFIKALAGTTGNMSQLIPSITDSQSKLISAASEYYRARIAVEELRLKAAMPEAEWAQQAATKNLEAEMQALRNRVDAAIAAAQSLGTQASAALNGLHASATITGSGSAQLGTSFSENWSKDITD